MSNDMFLGADKVIFQRAEALRKNQTRTELILWDYLKQKPLGYKFRRQHPLGIYISDFYCHPLKLVIEVDGGVHQEEEVAMYDVERQKNLEAAGLRFLRFTDKQVLYELEAIITTIENDIKRASASPEIGESPL